VKRGESEGGGEEDGEWWYEWRVGTVGGGRVLRGSSTGGEDVRASLWQKNTVRIEPMHTSKKIGGEKEDSLSGGEELEGGKVERGRVVSRRDRKVGGRRGEFCFEEREGGDERGLDGRHYQGRKSDDIGVGDKWGSVERGGV